MLAADCVFWDASYSLLPIFFLGHSTKDGAWKDSGHEISSGVPYLFSTSKQNPHLVGNIILLLLYLLTTVQNKNICKQ